MTMWSGTIRVLGRVCLAKGDAGGARRRFEEALVIAGEEKLEIYHHTFASILSGLEETYDAPQAFRAFCRAFKDEHPECRDSAFVRWHLEHADEGVLCDGPLYRDAFAGSLAPGWVWEDPFDDCSLDSQHGIEIHAVNGRGLWHLNLSAPRLLRVAPTEGDFAVQTVCSLVSGDMPTIGGLLLWKEKENFLRLDRGARGKREVSLEGCVDNRDMIIGRGRLPAPGSVGGQVNVSLDRIWLRFERIGERLSALCGADGEEWFSVGEVAFPVDGSLQVGLYAVGMIDRAIYPGAYPDGTAIRFESFTMWGLDR